MRPTAGPEPPHPAPSAPTADPEARPVVADRPLSRMIDVLDAGVSALRALAAPIDAWFDERRRSARDYRELANMSDRELHDIGVSRASVRAVAEEGWVRDWTH